jgi:hypothetical protein
LSLSPALRDTASAAAILLHDMRQLMRNQGIAEQGSWLIFARPKGNVLAHCKSTGVEPRRKVTCVAVRMEADMREVHAKGGFHPRFHSAAKPPSAAKL